MPHPSLLTAAADFATLRAAHPLRPTSVRGCPGGGGAPVLVFPGLLGTDRQTRQFRDCLQMLGYHPLPWQLGLNRGPTPRLLEAVAARVSTLARAHGPLRLVGFGMGGTFARWAAQSRAHAVAQTITVQTPFRDKLDTAWRSVNPVLHATTGLDLSGLSFMIRQPPDQPWAWLASRKDGVVPYASCTDPNFPQNGTETTARHSTCMRDEPVFRAVAARLAEVG
jgi:pimeloyl-ACP methyl ester carboxylesterase